MPRLLALLPAGVVSVTLSAYGLMSSWVAARSLAAGTTIGSEFTEGWAVTATLLVFLGWGVALGVAAWGYYLVTRPRCEVCQPSTPPLAPGQPSTPE